MPGIVGLISARPAAECERMVQAMSGTMQHEPFYVSGFHSAPELGVYGGWVAMEGSPAARQPFLNESKDVTILLSGECFADPAVIADLARRGHDVGSQPGDWMVHAYEEQGDRFFENLNGLFSGFLIDKRQNRAFLFNDRYGIERLYCHETNDSLYFASEAKALLHVLPGTRMFDTEGVAQFLEFGCTLEWKTLFRGISLLSGGSLWSFKNGRIQKQQYFVPTTWESQRRLSPEGFELKFQETFTRILPRYFESNSRIGISLTGGLDTRMIMACRPQTTTKPVCYTFCGERGRTLDASIAARVAKTCGLKHDLLRIGADFFSDFALHVNRTVYVTDGCSGPSGAHEIYFNQKARALASVRLTGNFGSEVFRGMSTFKPRQLAKDFLASDFRRSVADGWQHYIPAADPHPVTFAAFNEVPWNLFGSLAAGRSQVTFRTPYLDNELVALAYQSPLTQRNSSLPAQRFVGRNHPEMSRIPTDRGDLGVGRGMTWMLRRFFAEVTFKLDYFHMEGLPPKLGPFDPLVGALSFTGALGLHKFLPYRHWYRHELAGYLRDTLGSSTVRQSNLWNPEIVQTMLQRHLSSRNNYIAEFNAIITLDAVQRTLFRSESREF